MKIKKDLRIYVDNSVVNAPFDTGCDHAAQAKPFWDAVIGGNVRIIVSDILDEEMEGAPKEVREFFGKLPASQIERVLATDESNTLAELYISAGFVTENSRTDCRHIAIATICQADFIFSFNCKHMLNAFKQHGYNGINMVHGYKTIEIKNPYEVINEDDTF